MDSASDAGGDAEGETAFRTVVLPSGEILILRRVHQVLPTGEEYEGELLENRRHGNGVMTRADGTSYVGEFKHGLYDGQGTLTLGTHRIAGRVISGWKYVGEWRSGKRHGSGLWVSGEGDLYEGDWKFDRFDGRGRHEKRNGDVYNGWFVNGLRHGEGELRLAEGASVYKGGFLKGEFHGEGEMMYGRGGGSYKGTFKLGKRHGIGRRRWSTGAEYEGEWRDDVPWGRGVYRSPAGDVFVGDFVEGQFEGYGTLQYARGDRYVGQFQRNAPCGVGRIDYAAGGYYEGEFWALARTGVKWRREEADERAEKDPDGEGGLQWKSGTGKLTSHSEVLARRKAKEERVRRVYDHVHPMSKRERLALVASNRKFGRILVGSDRDDPDAYQGIVRPVADGKRHGRGVRVWTSGARYEGDWFQDEMHGFGIYIGAGPAGERYEGQFQFGKRQGRGVCSYGNIDGGTYVCPLGRRLPGDQRSIYDGEWVDGYFHGTGKFLWGDGRYYAGLFRRGAKHGFGVEVFLNLREIERELQAPGGDVRMVHRIREYQGDYKDGVRDGRGKALMATGDLIEGTFIAGRLHGPCKYTFKSYGTGGGLPEGRARGQGGKGGKGGGRGGVRRGRVSYAFYEMGHRRRWLKGEELESVMAAEATLALVKGDALSTDTLREQLKARAAERDREAAERARPFDLRKVAVSPDKALTVVGSGSIGKRALLRDKRRKERASREMHDAEVRERYGLTSHVDDDHDEADTPGDATHQGDKEDDNDDDDALVRTSTGPRRLPALPAPPTSTHATAASAPSMSPLRARGSPK